MADSRFRGAWHTLDDVQKFEWLLRLVDLFGLRPSPLSDDAEMAQATDELLRDAHHMAKAAIELSDRIPPQSFVTPAEEPAGYLLENPAAFVLTSVLGRVGSRAHEVFGSSETQDLEWDRVAAIMSSKLPGSVEPVAWAPVSLGLRAVVLAAYWRSRQPGVFNEKFAPPNPDNEEISDEVGIQDSVTAIATTAQATATGHAATALTAGDLAVYPVLDLEHEADVRRMVEPLPQLITSAIEDGAFDHDPMLLERVTTDRDFLVKQMQQSGPGELRLPVVSPLATDLLKSLAATKPDDPEAAIVIDVAEAAGPNEFDEEAAIRQRDEFARTSGKPRALVDEVLFTFPGAISTTGAVLGLYGGAVAGHWEGALLGILVAVISATVARARR